MNESSPADQERCILDAVKALRAHDKQVIELRALHAPTSRTGIVSGYYDDPAKLARDAVRLDREKAGGIYVTLNEIDPALLARAANRLRYHVKTGETTADAHVTRRLWLPIDVDPRRPSGTSSTDEQIKIAEVVRGQCAEKMREWFGVEPTIVGFSGNGWHLLYRMDEPITGEVDEAIKVVLQTLDAEAYDPSIIIDKSNFNPSRIWKLYGTTARKGDPIPGRPHRLSRFSHVNAEVGTIARALVPGGCFYIWGGFANWANYCDALSACGLYFAQGITWVKDHPVLGRKDFMNDCEHAWYGWREGAGHKFYGPNNARNVWHVKKVNPQSMVHLTEKPVELAVRALQYSSRPGENVLDQFGGSGSTLIAAEQTGRKAYLMELDALYCDVIVQRYEKFTGKKAERLSARSNAPVDAEALN